MNVVLCIVEDTWEGLLSESAEGGLALKFLPFTPMTR
jgi:hypothetical protein